MPKKANKTQKYGKKPKAKANFKFLDRFFRFFQFILGCNPPPQKESACGNVVQHLCLSARLPVMLSVVFQPSSIKHTTSKYYLDTYLWKAQVLLLFRDLDIQSQNLPDLMQPSCQKNTDSRQKCLSKNRICEGQN